MKKSLVIIMSAAVLMFLTFYGCKKNTPSGPSSPQNTNTITTTSTNSNATPTVTATNTISSATPTITATGTSSSATPTVTATGTNSNDTPTVTATVTITMTDTMLPTASETSTAVASPNLTGSLTLPAAASGKQYAVVVDDDANTANGFLTQIIGTCGASTVISYAFHVTDNASYYVYAYVDVNSSGMTGPGGMDYFGTYGSNPVNVPTGGAADGVDITLTQLPMFVTLNVTIPSAAVGNQAVFGLFPALGIQMDAVAGAGAHGSGYQCPAGTAFKVTFTVQPNLAGSYYLVGFVDANNNCPGTGGCMPDENDYVAIYGGSFSSIPASPNVTVDGDLTLNLNLAVAGQNVQGTAYLPGPANNNNYIIYVSTLPLGGNVSPVAVKTAVAGSGSSFNYGMFMPIPGNYYITLFVDMDNSGWTNSGNGPLTPGDFAGIYGVTPPITNWMAPFPANPNAVLPGSNLDIHCDTYPVTYQTPTPVPTPYGGSGEISGTITIPAGQNTKTLMLFIDMDLNPNNGNELTKTAETVISTDNAGTFDYTVTGLPVGTYYVYAAATTGGPVESGDPVGIYGTTYPVFPGSPNVSVTDSGNTQADITMVVTTANLWGRMYLPAAAPGKNYYVLLDTDTDGSNGFISLATGVCGGSPYVDYSLAVPLPGNYYVYGYVDVDSSGGAPNCGDYIGFYSYPDPYPFDPAADTTGVNFNTSGNLLSCP